MNITSNFLIVEDDSLHAKLLAGLLKSSHPLSHFPDGLDVCIVKSIPEAIRALREKEHQAILLDLKLPTIRGVEGIEELTRLFPHIPIIVYSGYSDRDIVRASIRAGASDYIVKGTNDAEEITQRIYVAIERHPRICEMNKLLNAV